MENIAKYNIFLQHLAGALSYSHAYFGSGPIQLDNVQCSGNERYLLNCTHLTVHNCGHYKYVGVTCAGGEWQMYMHMTSFGA